MPPSPEPPSVAAVSAAVAAAIAAVFASRSRLCRVTPQLCCVTPHLCHVAPHHLLLHLTFAASRLHAPTLRAQPRRKSVQPPSFDVNIQDSKVVADIIRTTLGPRSMLKILLDSSGVYD